ncbi:MAG: hypothetical protein NTAFB05_25910 [Nitrobacter sp.]
MSDNPRANDATLDALRDLRQGLHFAMDAALKYKDERKAEEILRQVDHRLGVLIDELTTAASR